MGAQLYTLDFYARCQLLASNTNSYFHRTYTNIRAVKKLFVEQLRNAASEKGRV